MKIHLFRVVSSEYSGFHLSFKRRFVYSEMGNWFIGTKAEAREASRNNHVILIKVPRSSCLHFDDLLFQYKWRGKRWDY